MKKRNILRKMICVVLTAVMVIQCVPFQSFASTPAKANEETNVGINFSRNTLIRTRLAYSKAITTFEATIEFPADSTGKGGVILGNYKREGESCYSFEIDESGAPRLYLVGNDTFDYCFNEINVYTGEKMHLAVVRDLSNSEMRCYVDGTLKQTLTTDANDMEAIQPSNVACLGSDLRATNDNYCRGKILNVKVYSDVRSASEIAGDVTALSKNEIIAYYDLENVTSDDAIIPDGSGNGMDLYPLVWLDERPNIDAYDFSMVAIGDTQFVTQDYGQSLSKIYDYVLNHAEEHNTQFVFGLGDIVNRNTDEQWSVAKEQISRMNGLLRYSLVRGNHDTQGRINTNFPYSDFATMMQTNYPGHDFGAYNEQEIQNTWQELTVDSLKYLIFALDSGASDEVLAWASDVIKAHPEHRVIITTHAYLNVDGSTLDAQEASAPTNWTDHNKVDGIVNNNGDHIWDEFVKQHENIQMVLCGHIDADNVVVTQSEGVHGNIVTSMLIDPQGMDAEIEGGTGMVATLYFSQGGNKVQVEYYSPIRNQWLVSMPQDSLDLNSEADVYVDEANIADYTIMEGSTITRNVPHLDKPGYEDYIFAGWYRDFACTTPVENTVTEGQFFAKYLPADTFTVKCQTSTDFSENDATAKLRIVSTVDNLRYSAVGFDIVYRAGESNEVQIPHNTNTVYPKIDASENGVEYQYSPNIFDLNSEYFMTATLVGIEQVDYGKLIKITPYIITKDGTKSTGTTRYVRMADVYQEMINVPVTVNNNVEEQSGTVKLSYDSTLYTYTGSFDQGDFGTSTVTDNQDGTISITSDNVKGSGVLANLRFSKNNNAIIPKKTTFDVIEENFGGTIGSLEHIQYSTDYQGVADTSWYNETDRAFVITSPAELYGVAELSNTRTDFSNQKIYLGADIVVNSGTVEEWLAEGFDKTTLYKWEQSIGINARGKRFDGTFDGQGHSIRGIYNDHTEANYGFFGTIASNAVIRNLSLEDSYISNTGHTTGGVVGLANGGDIINVHSSVQLESVDHTGGVVGRTNTVNKVDIIGCWYDGNISVTGKGAGGILGTAYGHSEGNTTKGPQPVTISDCLYTGTIASTYTGTPSLGGILARTDSAYCAEVDVDNCISDGKITLTSSVTAQTGSFIGYIFANTKAYVDNSFATMETYGSSSDDIVGVGTPQGTGVAYIAREFLDGYLGYTLISNKDNADIWVAREGKAPGMAMFADGLDMEDAIVADTSWYNEGETTHTIIDEGDLYGFAKLSLTNNFNKHTVVLGNDISINDTTDLDTWKDVAPKYEWMPIGHNKAFQGTFGSEDNGKVYSISGVYMDTNSYVAGLFATSNGTIKNLKLLDSYLESSVGQFASIAGKGHGNILNVYSNASVVAAGNYVGGISGLLTVGLTMQGCWFDGSVSGNRHVGGLIGNVGNPVVVDIKDSLNTGTITSTDASYPHMGGILGSTQAKACTVTIANCIGAGKFVTSITDNTSKTTVGSILGQQGSTSDITINRSLGLSSARKLAVGTNTAGVTLKGTGATAIDNQFMKGYLGYALIATEQTKNAWSIREDSIPVPSAFAESLDRTGAITADTSWYDGSGIYTLNDANDLYGLSVLSLVNSFEGEQIILGADIQINDTTDYDSWSSTAPKYQWLPIGFNTYFAGTFGGVDKNSIHTIRGIYMKNDLIKSGLISKTTAAATVQNLRLEDSYFEGTSTVESWIGSIVGDAAGTFQSIYSNADVILKAQNANPYSGGMFGIIFKNGLSARECWFDGTVTSNNQYVGGFAGAVGRGTVIDFVDCLMTGTVTSITSSDTVSAYTAGFIGYALSAESINLTDCLNTGTVRVSRYSDWVERRSTASVIGCVKTTVLCADVYTIEQVEFIDGTPVTANLWRPGIGWVGNSLDVKGTTSEIVSIDSVKATGGYTLTGLDFSESGSWTARMNDAPALKVFVPAQDVYTK